MAERSRKVAVAIAVIVLIVVVAIWGQRWLVVRQSAQALAFSTTFAAALFLITGIIGFGLQKGPALLSPARWSEGVIWRQVVVGTAFLIAAVFCWRRAVKDAERRLQRSNRQLVSRLIGR
jgi:hypothetical protein